MWGYEADIQPTAIQRTNLPPTSPTVHQTAIPTATNNTKLPSNTTQHTPTPTSRDPTRGPPASVNHRSPTPLTSRIHR
jgi:hypothetical protein